jgi:hypothetical protein
LLGRPNKARAKMNTDLADSHRIRDRWQKTRL